MQAQRVVVPLFGLALAVVAGAVYWHGLPSGSDCQVMPEAGSSPRSGQANDVYLTGPSSPGHSSSEPGSPPAPRGAPPGTDPPAVGRSAEASQGLTGDAAHMAVRLEEAFANPDRRCVTRIRAEMLHAAQTNPSVLADLAKSAPLPRHRSWALRILGEAKASESHDVAVAALRDPVDYVRANAAWALGQVGTREDLPALESLSTGADQPESVRKAAAEATSNILHR